jgi:hypothetical protein
MVKRGKRRRSKKVKGQGRGKRLALVAGAVGLTALAAYKGRQHLIDVNHLKNHRDYLREENYRLFHQRKKAVIQLRNLGMKRTRLYTLGIEDPPSRYLS